MKKNIIIILSYSLTIYSMEQASTHENSKHLTTILALRNVKIPENFVAAFPKELLPNENDSYENNNIINIVPDALKVKDRKFRDTLMGHIINNVDDHKRFWIVALVHAGADHNIYPNVYDVGYRPLRYIQGTRDDRYARALLERGVDPNKCTFSSALFYAQTYEIASLLLEYGASLNAKTTAENTLLHHVAKNPDFDAQLLQFYCNKNLNVNEKNLVGRTPFHWLIKNLSLHTAEALEQKATIFLKNGADIALKDDAGKTVVDLLLDDMRSDSLLFQENRKKYEILYDTFKKYHPEIPKKPECID